MKDDVAPSPRMFIFGVPQLYLLGNYLDVAFSYNTFRMALNNQDGYSYVGTDSLISNTSLTDRLQSLVAGETATQMSSNFEIKLHLGFW